jgi:hypothetical protein
LLTPQTPAYYFIDPYEIQCFPPREVDDAITKESIEYPDLLEGVAGILITRSPRFAQDLAPFLESYLHEHNFDYPLTEAELANLKAMIQQPETVCIDDFKCLAPRVLLKACTLAVETFLQSRPSWVLKAIPQLPAIKDSLLPSTGLTVDTWLVSIRALAPQAETAVPA